MSTTPTHPSRTPLGAGRIILIVVMAVVGFGLALVGGAIVVAHGTLRDADGFFTSATERYATSTRALTSEDLSVVRGTSVEVADGEFATVRLRVTPSEGNPPVFVGIARAGDVDAYLRGVSHDEITSVDFDPFRFDVARRSGARTPVAPADQAFWAARAMGSGTQEVRWTVESGAWSAVVMNADGSAGVAVDASVGAKVKYVLGIGIGLLVAGLALFAGAIALTVRGGRSTGGQKPISSAQGDPMAAGRHDLSAANEQTPVLLEGQLEGVSRWLWLVKWALAIPHWIVLAFLWIAFWVLSIGAFFAILFTGRYPRGIFDINVGVMRWTWRVAFYSYSALGTDRYPPFTLHDVPDYPARLDVAYPEHLSRGLVLVKSWLLAIPHLIIVAIFTGGWAIGAPGLWGAAGTGGFSWEGFPGLIGVLVLISAVMLLFTNRYPRELFDLVIGLNRWVYRVAVYVSLMRDEYPPFRLDSGGRETGVPAERPPGPPVPAAAPTSPVDTTTSGAK